MNPLLTRSIALKAKSLLFRILSSSLGVIISDLFIRESVNESKSSGEVAPAARALRNDANYSILSDRNGPYLV